MKKLVLTTLAILTVAQTFAHTRYERRCRYHTNRYGDQVRRCRTVQVDHHHHDDGYADGVIDGMTSSSYLALTTSDIFDGSDKADAIQSEISLTLALMADGIDMELSQELRDIVEDVKSNNDTLSESSDEEILELLVINK